MSHMALLVWVLLSTVTASTQTGDVLPGTVGGNVTLNCSTNETITNIKKVIVKWIHENSSVLVFKDGKLYNEEQDTRFEGRAELADTGLRDGNLSIRLKNVKQTDNGKYKCFFNRQSPRQKRAVKTPLKTINLRVVDENLPVTVGQTVTLNCSMPVNIRDVNKVVVEWRREDSNVLVIGGNTPLTDDQDPHFKGRAEMADPGLKDGNLSMVLKNVMKTDSGIYQCYFKGESPRQKRAADTPVKTINLVVVDKPVNGGHRNAVGLVFVLVLVAVIVGFVLVFFVFKRRFKKSQNPHPDANTDNDKSVKVRLSCSS